jgi:hypothetical protein
VDDVASAPKARDPRARKGGPIGHLGSESGGALEVLPGGKRRRIASTPQGNRYASAEAEVAGETTAAG